jgi:uncharacterized Zn-binding protein involved in type VI secretion
MRSLVWILVLACAVVPSTSARAADTDVWKDIKRGFAEGFSGASVRGSGTQIEETRVLSGYSALVLDAPIDVTLKAGSTERVTLRADDNILPLIETKVIDGRLEIVTRSGVSFSTRHPPKATVEYKQLNAIRMKGSGDVRADVIKAPVLELVIGGSGDVIIDRVEVDVLGISAAGSGDVTARGRAKRVGVVVEGSGDVDVAGVEATEAAVRVRGSGDVKVDAAERLEVDVSGSGDVRYRGLPQVKKKVRGSGSVAPLK